MHSPAQSGVPGESQVPTGASLSAWAQPAGHRALAGCQPPWAPAEPSSGQAALTLLFLLCSLGQGQAEPQESGEKPEEFPFKCAERGAGHVEGLLFSPGQWPAQGQCPSLVPGFDFMEPPPVGDLRTPTVPLGSSHAALWARAQIGLSSLSPPAMQRKCHLQHLQNQLRGSEAGTVWSFLLGKAGDLSLQAAGTTLSPYFSVYQSL